MMAFSKHVMPPLSPILLAGVALKAMPLAALNPLLAKAIKVMVMRHRDVFERLSCIGNATFAIDPTDLPFVFLLRPDLDAPSLIAVRVFDDTAVTASIHGSFTILTELLEGAVDGDALVFSRDLVIEGDTEAVLALRNAVDGGDIHIKQDLASIFGPFSRVATKAADGVLSLVGHAGSDMEILQGAMIGGISQRVEENSVQIDEIQEELDALKKQMKKIMKRS